MKGICFVLLLCSFYGYGQNKKHHYFFAMAEQPVTGATLADSVQKILSARLYRAGYKDCTVSFIPGKNQLEVSSSKPIDTGFITTQLIRPGKVNFFETYQLSELMPLFQPDSTIPEVTRHLLDDFTSLIHAAEYDAGNGATAFVGFVDIKDTAAFTIAQKALHNYWPADMTFAYQLQNTGLPNGALLLYALHNNSKQLQVNALLDSAAVNINYSGYPVVLMHFNQEGALLFHQMTLQNIRRSIAIVIDDVIYSAPTIVAPVEGGKVEIAGNFTMMETIALVHLLNAGQLPLALTPVHNFTQ